MPLGLPETLDNESGKIELVTELVRGDIERLEATLTRRPAPLARFAPTPVPATQEWILAWEA